MTDPKRPAAPSPWDNNHTPEGFKRWVDNPCLCTTSVVLDRVLVNLNRECPRHGVKSCK